MTPSHGITSNVGEEVPAMRVGRDPSFSSFNSLLQCCLNDGI